MTNLNKLNATQKEVMTQFMAEHPDLAKSLLPNCAQGKSTANRLWNVLTKELNAAGPPIKDSKLWRKVFADQKYNTKRKLSFNKASKRRRCGGPYQKKMLTPVEELLVEAAGLEACVEGNKNIRTPSHGSRSSRSDDESSSTRPDLPSTSIPSYTPARTPQSCATPKGKRSQETKTALFEENMKLTAEHQQVLYKKFDRMLEINERQLHINERQLEIDERQLQIKEEKHLREMEAWEIDFKIKCLELETLEVKLGK